MIANLCVFVDSRKASADRLALAIRIAKQHGSSLTVVWVELPPETANSYGAATYFARGGGIRDVVDRFSAIERDGLSIVRTRLDEARRSDGLRSDIRELPFASGAASAITYASYTDVVMLAQPAPRSAENHPYGWSTEDIIREARVPAIIVPATLAREYTGDRIMVAWNASSESHRAVADAMPLLAAAKTVQVVTVNATIDVRSHGDEPGADIARHLAKHNVRVEVVRLATNGKSLAETILNHAVDFGADLLVVGAYGRGRTSEVLFGSTTHALLMGTRCPLLLSR